MIGWGLDNDEPHIITSLESIHTLKDKTRVAIIYRGVTLMRSRWDNCNVTLPYRITLENGTELFRGNSKLQCEDAMDIMNKENEQ